MLDAVKKFSGGTWIGYIFATWPFGKLEVSPSQLIISIEGLPFYSKKIEHRFVHQDIEKIEIKNYIPFLAHGIRITPRDKSNVERFYFWYWTSRFDNLVNALKECGWLID